MIEFSDEQEAIFRGQKLKGVAAFFSNKDAPHFDGKYDIKLDHGRLSGQLVAVRAIMGDLKPHSLQEMAKITGFPEGSISARIRDLRKVRFGAEVIRAKRQKGNFYTYTMMKIPY